jgi:hypothetical protein
MAQLIRLVSLNISLHLWSQISCIALGLVLLKGEQNFKLGFCVGTHKTPISCAIMSSACYQVHVGACGPVLSCPTLNATVSQGPGPVALPTLKALGMQLSGAQVCFKPGYKVGLPWANRW